MAKWGNWLLTAPLAVQSVIYLSEVMGWAKAVTVVGTMFFLGKLGMEDEDE